MTVTILILCIHILTYDCDYFDTLYTHFTYDCDYIDTLYTHFNL